MFNDDFLRREPAPPSTSTPKGDKPVTSDEQPNHWEVRRTTKEERATAKFWDAVRWAEEEGLYRA